MTTHLGPWLYYLGLNTIETSELMGTSPVAISLAVSKGARRGWVEEFANKLGLPVKVILDYAPLDPLVTSEWSEWRAEAIEKAARWRLEFLYRGKRPQRAPNKVKDEQLAA